MKRMIALGVLVAAGVAFFGLDGQAEVYLGQQVSPTTPVDRIDHSAWKRLLQKYVDEDGMVNYRSWRDNAADRQSLSDYLSHLSTADVGPESSHDGRLAFWINAYNAVTVHGILREYPTSSIRNHTPRVVGYNIWKHLQLYVGGRPYSLNDIEHKVLRRMEEPQIHFAIVCASIGCPRLLNEAYVPDRVHEQLDANSRDFFSRSQNFRYRDGAIYLSSILDWFGRDFGSSQDRQLKRIANWLPQEEAQTAAKSGRVDVRFLDYDWNLNEQQ